MGEMVERVARAMAVADGVDPDDGCWYPGQEGPPLKAWEMRFGSARAAIEAMRAPTGAMIEECDMIDLDFNHGDGCPGWQLYWDAMLDAALTEGDDK